MEVISGNISPSALNPNAPAFIPSAYRDVEDFSVEWWSLVQSSPWFRDYWFRECFTDPEDPLETDDLSINNQKAKVNGDKESDFRKDLVALGVLKWHNGRLAAEKPRCLEKAPKIVNVRVSPRLIHQPR